MTNNNYKNAFDEMWAIHFPCKNSINLPSGIKDVDYLNATRRRIESIYKKKEKLTKYGCFITVNPDKSVTMENFLSFRNVINRKVLNKKWAKDALVMFEQRTEVLKPPWTGFHVHILIMFMDKIRPYKVNALKEISQSLTPHVAFTFNVDYKYLNTLEDYNRCHDYLTGYKADKTKRLKHKADLKMRKFFNIQ